MQIVILGNKGSVGSLLSSHLSLKHDVVGVDSDVMDLSKYQNYENYLKGLFDFDSQKIVIINCVGIMGAKESVLDPYRYYEINGILPFKLKQFFDSVLESYLFIQISSETVYGKSNNNEHVFTENDSCSPQHIYGLSKLVSEQLLKVPAKSGCSTLILRAPILLFKKQRYPNALTYIINEITKTGSATLFGNGEHKRRYLVEDMFVQVLEELIKCWSIDPTIFEPFKVLNMPGTEISPKEFVEILLRDYQKMFKVKYDEDAKFAFSLLSSSEEYVLTTKSTRSNNSANSLVSWILGVNE